MELSPDEKTRYVRQLNITGWDHSYQIKLKNARVFVAGAGGLGSSAIIYLAAAGIGEIIICDYDSVELSNLNRQILHRVAGIGTPKTLSARDTLVAFNDSIRIIPVAKKIESPGIPDLIGSADIVLDCLDSFGSRSKLNLMCLDLGKPLVHAGISEFHGQATVVHPPQTPCLNCFLPLSENRGPTPVLGATAGIMGAIQAMEAVKYLTGSGTTLENRLLFFDGLAMSFSTVKLSRNPHCTVCSGISK